MLTYRCACNAELTFQPEQGGSLQRCPSCNSPFTVPWPEEETTTWAEQGEDVWLAEQQQLQERQEEASFAGQTSGAHLFMLMFVFGPMAAALGYVAAAACAGGAILINIVHNLSPVFVFAMPIVIVFFMAITPAVYGLGVGAVVGEGAALIRHRHAASAGLVALFWTVAGLVAFPFAAEMWAPPGKSFFDDQLLPFVHLMIGGCINFTWLEKPEPVEISSKIIYGLLGASALLGVMCAYGNAEEKSQPKLV